MRFETVLRGLLEDLGRPDTVLAAAVAAWLHNTGGHTGGAEFAVDFVVVFLVLKNTLGI